MMARSIISSLCVILSLILVLIEPSTQYTLKIREKRDVIKGVDSKHNLNRVKRYIGRVPVDYMKRSNPYYHPQQEIDPFPERRLTDEEIQTLLLMLENYNRNRGGLRPHVPLRKLDKVMEALDDIQEPQKKRETGRKRLVVPQPAPVPQQQREQEEPANNYAELAFLLNPPSKRSVRKAPTLKNEMTKKAKKSIDWSEYFGIDKRSVGIPSSEDSTSSTTPPPPPTRLLAQPVSLNSVSGKGRKPETPERLENETMNKDAVPDKNWMMNEFYKNFAMMTNVRRRKKRDNEKEGGDSLKQLAKELTELGDKIVWDALKYTGAHRDENLNKEGMKKVKQDLFKKLATAYKLEAARKELEEIIGDVEE